MSKRLLVNRGKGPEGWIPLWAKLAPKEKAERVIANMLDTETVSYTHLDVYKRQVQIRLIQSVGGDILFYITFQ